MHYIIYTTPSTHMHTHITVVYMQVSHTHTHTHTHIILAHTFFVATLENKSMILALKKTFFNTNLT